MNIQPPITNIDGSPFNSGQLLPLPLIEVDPTYDISLLQDSTIMSYITYLDTLKIKPTTVQLNFPGNTNAEKANSFREFWKTFFFQFQSYIKKDFYNKTSPSLSNPGDDTQQTINRSYYDHLFAKTLKEFQQSAEVSFESYIQNNSEIQYRQKNVIFWQFLRALELMEELQNTLINQVSSKSVHTTVLKTAVNKMAGVNVPALKSISDDDDYDGEKPIIHNETIPSPRLLQVQGEKQQKIEEYKQDQKNANHELTQADANLGFTQDAQKSQRDSLNKFWSTMNRILESVMNK
ncbi:hypothetical protein N9N03_00940 [Chlamydiia bacterium]|nr:hypothetical protein [Chlamydiia bacterium]